jgi:hypothetical protein
MLNIYTLYLQILSTNGALLVEIGRVGRSSKQGWVELAEGLGSYASSIYVGSMQSQF